jgi:hypothetical protein
MLSFPLPIAAFAAGLVSFLTPCVLPLFLGYISLISGAGLDELKLQGANPLASGGKDGVAQRRQSRPQRGLAQTRRCAVGLAPVHLNLGRLPHAHQRVVMEVRLLDPAVYRRDLLSQMAHSLDD